MDQHPVAAGANHVVRISTSARIATLALALVAITVFAANLVAGAEPDRTDSDNQATPAAALEDKAVERGTSGAGAALPADDDESAAPLRVRYQEGRLTLRAANVPLAEVLGALARESGAEIRGRIPEREVSAEFENLPLHKALATLLDKNSFMLTYSPEGRLRAIELVGGGSSVLAVPAATPAATAEATPAAASDDTPSPEMNMTEADRSAAFLRRTTVEVSGLLIGALGTSRPSAGYLISAALSQPSTQLRAQAQRATLEAFAANPELEKSYYFTLQSEDDANSARRLRRMHGRGSAEFMEKLANGAQTPELRAKAAAILEELRALPEGDLAE